MPSLNRADDLDRIDVAVREVEPDGVSQASQSCNGRIDRPGV